MHVLFVDPAFPRNQREFVRALRSLDARVTGIGERPARYLDRELEGWLHGYEQVHSVTEEQALVDCVRRVQARDRVDLLEATVEAHVLAAARAREICGIRGTSFRTAWLCRDKPSMKAALHASGIRTARWITASSPGEARDFAMRVGYPVVVKPRAGAGAARTARVDDEGRLVRALGKHVPGPREPILVEEFIAGEEGMWDALVARGRVVHEFVSLYRPAVLEAMRTRRISPQIVATNRVEDPCYRDVKRLGRRAIEALGIETSAIHMEWFRGPRGSVLGEVACRPPGVRMWDLYCAANDMDLYREWARLLVHRPPSGFASRRRAAGLIALRPDRDGRILGYEGFEGIRREYGDFVLDGHLPPTGSSTRPPGEGYMANAWIRLIHPDYDSLCRILDDVGNRVQVRAG